MRSPIFLWVTLLSILIVTTQAYSTSVYCNEIRQVTSTLTNIISTPTLFRASNISSFPTKDFVIQGPGSVTIDTSDDATVELLINFNIFLTGNATFTIASNSRILWRNPMTPNTVAAQDAAQIQIASGALIGVDGKYNGRSFYTLFAACGNATITVADNANFSFHAADFVEIVAPKFWAFENSRISLGNFYCPTDTAPSIVEVRVLQSGSAALRNVQAPIFLLGFFQGSYDTLTGLQPGQSITRVINVTGTDTPSLEMSNSWVAQAWVAIFSDSTLHLENCNVTLFIVVGANPIIAGVPVSTASPFFVSNLQPQTYGVGSDAPALLSISTINLTLSATTIKPSVYFGNGEPQSARQTFVLTNSTVSELQCNSPNGIFNVIGSTVSGDDFSYVVLNLADSPGGISVDQPSSVYFGDSTIRTWINVPGSSSVTMENVTVDPNPTVASTFRVWIFRRFAFLNLIDTDLVVNNVVPFIIYTDPVGAVVIQNVYAPLSTTYNTCGNVTFQVLKAIFSTNTSIKGLTRDYIATEQKNFYNSSVTDLPVIVYPLSTPDWNASLRTFSIPNTFPAGTFYYISNSVWIGRNTTNQTALNTRHTFTNTQDCSIGVTTTGTSTTSTTGTTSGTTSSTNQTAATAATSSSSSSSTSSSSTSSSSTSSSSTSSSSTLSSSTSASSQSSQAVSRLLSSASLSSSTASSTSSGSRFSLSALIVACAIALLI